MAKQREARLHLSADLPLSLRRVTGREEVSRLFHYDLVLLAQSHDIELDRLLGTGMTVELDGNEGTRTIDGVVADATYRGEMEDQARYDVVLVPWLWFLDRRSDCRIFQHLNAIEIVKQVVAEHGGDLQDQLTGHFQERDYCVQYRESDFNFICRLLEEEGVFFFFEHAPGRHSLVLGDDPARCRTRPGYMTVPYYPLGDSGRRERDHLNRWEIVARARSARTALRSFDFKKPAKPLEAADQAASRHARDDLEVYDYPGRFDTTDGGDAQARLRLEELRADRRRVVATGNAVGLACGHRFTLRNFPRDEQNIEYLILATDTVAEIEPQRAAAGTGAEPYACSIEAMSTRLPFRPARLTPRPFVHGPQTAIVTGPPGEEIYTDEHGRVKIQFHWDRLGQFDANTSCWVRVSHAWAGAGFGAMQIPRIGQEVIVDFLEGDPDQPIITGRVYNAHQMPPHGLPGNAVKSGIKSSSTKGGGGSNELTFNDTKGKEQTYFHSQYDHDGLIEHDETRHVKNNRTLTVDGTHTETIKQKTSIKVTDGDYAHAVVAGSATHSVKGPVTETFDSTQSTTVKANIDITSTSGAIAVSSNAQHVYVSASTSIQLHVGSSMIWMDSGGQISIKGVNVSIEGSASVTIKGAMVMLNP